MNEEELNEKFKQYGMKYPLNTCVFHTELDTILSLPLYLKRSVSFYIDEAENNPEIVHINSFRLEKQAKYEYAIFYSFTPTSKS